MHTTSFSGPLFPDTQRLFCPKIDPKKSSLHPLNWTSLCAVDVFLIAEKAGGLLVKPWASRLSGGPPPTVGPPETLLYMGISLSGVGPSEIRFMVVHTQKENLLTVNSSLRNPKYTKTKTRCCSWVKRKNPALNIRPQSRWHHLSHSDTQIQEQKVNTVQYIANDLRHWLNPLNIKASVPVQNGGSDHISCVTRWMKYGTRK